MSSRTPRSPSEGPSSPSAKERYRQNMQSNIVLETPITSAARGRNSRYSRSPSQTHTRVSSAHSVPISQGDGCGVAFWMGRQRSVGAEALPRNDLGNAGGARTRPPPGGVSSLGGPLWNSAVHQDQRPLRHAASIQRTEETHSDSVSSCLRRDSTFEEFVSWVPGGSGRVSPERTLRRMVSPHGSRQSPPPLFGIVSPPFATDSAPAGAASPRAPAGGASSRPRSRAPPVADAAQVDQAMATSRPALAVTFNSTAAADGVVPAGCDFVRIAAEKLEAWKSFKQRHSEDLAQILDAARGTEAIAEAIAVQVEAIDIISSTEKNEILYPVSSEMRALGRRRDFRCPSQDSAIGNRKASPVMHPISVVPERPRLQARQRSRNSRANFREFKPLNRTIDSVASTRASIGSNSSRPGSSGCESPLASRRQWRR